MCIFGTYTQQSAYLVRTLLMCDLDTYIRVITCVLILTLNKDVCTWYVHTLKMCVLDTYINDVCTWYLHIYLK